MKQIFIKGARQNNLKNIDINIPRNKLVVFAGVSGSGKSSLVFEIITAEAQRQLYDTLSTFARSRLPKYDQADYDAVENLSPVIVLEQKRVSGNARSSVGTLSEVSSFLRLLFSRIGKPEVGMSNHFSAHSPEGMCRVCGGLGLEIALDISRVFDERKSLKEGAILFPDFRVNSLAWKVVANTGFFDLDKPLCEFSKEARETLLYAEEKPFTFGSGEHGYKANFNGIVTKIKRGFLSKDINALSASRKKIIRQFITEKTCSACDGAGLKREVLDCCIVGKNIYELEHLELVELRTFLHSIKSDIAATILNQLIKRLDNLIIIGLGYLHLARSSATLSGGEAQRVQIAKQLGNCLTEMLYVLDEPSVGLHPRDVKLVAHLLSKLRDKGNSVLVVEHDPDIIEIADHVIEMGPRAGAQGGEIVFEGSVDLLLRSATLTGRFLCNKLPPKTVFKPWCESFSIHNACAHNLKDIHIKIPKGIFVCLTGVAGSGKSSLMHCEFLRHYPEAVVIDQSPVGKSIRSNPATYTGVFDHIRELFAQANPGTEASLFSFNANGACQLCKGLGEIETDLAFMDPIRTPCEACGGTRYKQEAQDYRYQEKTIVEVLTLTINQALIFFTDRELRKKLQTLQEVGLGYLELGQPLSTLSGGECQRIKLASELHKEGQVYVLDEPTTGLHMSDIKTIVDLLERLVMRGNSVLVIEHCLDVMNQADWLIDLGPEGGSGGGEIVFCGTPLELQENSKGHTAQALRRYNTVRFD